MTQKPSANDNDKTPYWSPPRDHMLLAFVIACALFTFIIFWGIYFLYPV